MGASNPTPMSLTLLALFMLPLLLKVVLDPSNSAKFLKEWGASRGMQWMGSLLALMMALLIFSTSTPHFAWSWDSVLSWMGVLIALKGIAHLFPSVVAWKLRWVTEDRLPMFGFLGLLLLLAMVYIDTQLL